MIAYQRILLRENTFLRDVSVDLADFYANSVEFSIDHTTDFIYIGSIFPFNHKYFDVIEANTSASSMTFEYWNSNAWVPTRDKIDQTVVANATLARSGLSRFTPNVDISWPRVYESHTVQGLESTHIYNKYWSRVRFSADCEFELNFIGNRFSFDAELYSFYPDLNNSNLKLQYEAGKTTWDEQHLMAASAIIHDLIKRGHIFTQDQILSPESYQVPAIHRVAAYIYAAFGDGYREDKKESLAKYNEEMSKQFFLVDLNQNSRLDLMEHVSSSRFLKR